jgi:tRNA-specific 2-thiouridylase
MKNLPKNNKVIVGLSGGVDSSVSALLLLEQGYEVEAMFMKNWDEEDDENCSYKQDIEDAQQVADKLQIKLHTINFSFEYWEDVFAHFLQEYKDGRTPNPDVLCNQKIKFKVFLDYAMLLGADKIATGHYAKIDKSKDVYRLKKAFDNSKDQSYFLYLLNQQQLAKSIFPLSDISKKKVREIASSHNLVTANKKDSTGICFIGKRTFSKFLENYIPRKTGDIVDQDGNFIKHHNGVFFYTIGQRKGLGIGGGFGKSGEPWFVIDKDVKTNKLVVTQGQHSLLYGNTLEASNCHWIYNMPELPFKCTAKIRYCQQSQSCLIDKTKNNKLKVVFDNPQRAITPGQSIVFYDNDICLGGAIIDKRIN